MSGVKGRSGGWNRRPQAEHVARGTYRRDRHGPLAVASSSAVLVPVPFRGPAPEAPAGLSPESTALWRELVIAFDGWTVGDLALLKLALEALDDAQAARAQLAAQGLVIGTRAHPAVRIARAAESSALNIFRHLGIGGPAR
jgi:phage terminase small subunit